MYCTRYKCEMPEKTCVLRQQLVFLAKCQLRERGIEK
jgi:hypothetical protein